MSSERDPAASESRFTLGRAGVEFVITGTIFVLLLLLITLGSHF